MSFSSLSNDVWHKRCGSQTHILSHLDGNHFCWVHLAIEEFHSEGMFTRMLVAGH